MDNGETTSATRRHLDGPVRVSATIVTLNEEKNLARALGSLSCCDELLVVDSGSDDRTVAIAEEHGARVIQRDWSGYADQKNFAAQSAQHEWILSLDADEELSDLLAAQIRRLKSAKPDVDAYRFPRRARYLGKWIRHSGWYPDPKVRLYDRNKAKWVGGYVHESVVVNGRIGMLQGDLLHYTCDTIANHIQTVDRYTTLAADELLARGRRVGWLDLCLAPVWTSLKTYFLKLGFLDGVEGLAIAYMAGFYVFAKHAKARKWSAG